MFLINSYLNLFSVTMSLWYPFSRSYGVILPSSLTMLLPSALGFSPHPPVSVYGTGSYNAIAAFLDTSSIIFSTLISILLQLRLLCGFAYRYTTLLLRVLSSHAMTSLMCPHISDYKRCWNFNQLSIDYASPPRLRPRLTQGRQA